MNSTPAFYSSSWQSAYNGGATDEQVLKIVGYCALFCVGVMCAIAALGVIFYFLITKFAPKPAQAEPEPATTAPAPTTASTSAPQSFTNRPWYLI